MVLVPRAAMLIPMWAMTWCTRHPSRRQDPRSSNVVDGIAGYGGQQCPLPHRLFPPAPHIAHAEAMQVMAAQSCLGSTMSNSSRATLECLRCRRRPQRCQ